MKTKLLAFTLIIAVLTLGAVGTAQADDSKFVVKLGIADVQPKPNNGTLADGAFSVDIGNSFRPSVTLEYLITPNIGVEVLGAWPFNNDIKLNGNKAASVDVLPPTLSLQYHFLPEKLVSPFVGVGFNYTFIYNIQRTEMLAGLSPDIDNSWGFAAHAGVDFNLNKNWLLTADVRWIQMGGDVKLNGKKVGSTDIDPWVWGLAVGYRF